MSVVLNLLKLMKLSGAQPIVDPVTGFPTTAFQTLQNNRAINEETIVNAIVAQTNSITSALDQAGIATSAADQASTDATKANSNASTALATAGSVARQQAILASFPDPGILTASIDPADATKAAVSIAAHMRHYADGSSVAINPGTITGQPLGSTIYVFYIDAPRMGGSVAYQATATMAAAAQGFDRHTIGVITTPASGGASTTGSTAPAPGIPALR